MSPPVRLPLFPLPLVLVPAAFERHYLEKRAIPMPIVTDLTQQQIALFTERAWVSRLRAVHLTVQYNFGQAPRLRQRPQQDQPQPGSSPFGG